MIIAFLGIGLMGLPMAHNLINNGFNLQVYNRTTHKMAPLIARGATGFNSAREVVQGADIIISVLENAAIQEQVLINHQTLSNCKPGSLIIDMGSISPQAATEHAALAKQYQLSYIDAPVSGGTLGAEQAQLVIMAGAEARDLAVAQPIFSALAKETVHIGAVGSGQIAKCANQAVVGITISAISEALLFASQLGANPEAVRKALLGGFAQSKVLDQHGQRMLDRNFKPGGTVRVQHKDLSNVIDAAKTQNLSLPITQAVTDQYRQLNKSGQQDLDHSALLLHLEEINRIVLSTDLKDGAKDASV